MAAALCRRFFSAVRVSGVIRAPPGACLSGLTLNLLHKNSTKVEPLYQCKFLHTTLSRKGLEEFFDDPKNWGEIVVKSGDEWHAKHLRNKSNEDLHKLWYVLLKEKNMLLTLEQEAKRQSLPMPSPERLEKVEKSMGRIDLVIKEREVALRLLQTGHENPRPGEWRNDFLGRTYWYNSKEWPIPWYLNKKYNRRKFFYLPHVKHFIRLSCMGYLAIYTPHLSIILNYSLLYFFLVPFSVRCIHLQHFSVLPSYFMCKATKIFSPMNTHTHLLPVGVKVEEKTVLLYLQLLNISAKSSES